MTLATGKVGTYSIETGLMTRFVLGVERAVTIQLDYFCRYWEMVSVSMALVTNPADAIQWAYSRQGARGATGDGTTAYREMRSGDAPVHRRFERDDEGPPFIYLFTPATNLAPVVVEFEYFPSAFREGKQPTPSRGGIFPTAASVDGLIIPGI